MAIKNNICLRCSHSGICKIEDKIVVFDEDAKKSLGVDITIDKCKEYKEVE
jgi:predicted RNA-binding protein with TRAM domain